MENVNQSSPVARAIPVILFVVGLMSIYYLYQYLYGPSTSNAYPLVTKDQEAKVEPTQPIVIAKDKLPNIYEGGEFSVSTWFYVSNWSHRKGYNKAILRLGSPQMGGFDTLRIYLGAHRPKLSVRLHTRDSSATVNATVQPQNDALPNQMLQTVFETQAASGLLEDASPLCDLPEIDLQRWVHLVVAVNGKSVDVYLDGKLARSCVLPSFYKVDAGGYAATLLPYGGFGGHLSTTTMYDSALNPEQVYQAYAAGPEPITSFSDWLRSIFKFSVNVSVDSK